MPGTVTKIIIKPAIGYESCYIQGIKMRGATRTRLRELMGPPIATRRNTDDDREPDQAELLDNTFVWVTFNKATAATIRGDEIPSFIWFDLDEVSNRFNKKLILILQYKGKNYSLDKKTTPDILKERFPDISELVPDYPTDRRDRAFMICNDSIIVHCRDSKMVKVDVFLQTVPH